MINVKDFYNTFVNNEIDFFCGVPDSLLKDFCAYITDNASRKNHVITANEGNAVALAAGHYLACGKPAVVYMQNSGLGNCINPLLSLTDEEVYRIPLLMIVGHRGEPGVKDEPQHVKQGKVTDKILDSISVNYSVLPNDFQKASDVILNAIEYIKETKKPFALIIKKNTFEKYKLKTIKTKYYTLTREDAVKQAASFLDEKDIIVSTTGQISRELYEYRESKKELHQKDFLTVGSMGHASSIALGIALEHPERTTYCFDGDGAFIMHMGALPVISSMKLKNFRHIVFNNEAHDSVGSQPTSADKIDFRNLSKACGYDKVFSVKTIKELNKALQCIKNFEGTVLIEVKVKCGARENLGRPKEKPCENKERFMSFLEENIAFTNENSISNLSKTIKKLGSKKVLLFTGKHSYMQIQTVLKKQLKGLSLIEYNDFSVNPKAEEIEKALTKQKDFDVIVAVGGGSVLDFAKLFRFCYDNNILPENALKNDFCAVKKTPLIAIPTTAGTGAEATKFAVIYVQGQKHSFEHQHILPDYAIIESSFVRNNPHYLKACCGADALCQAIESYWSVNSTNESKYYARLSMELCRDYLKKHVNSKDSRAAQMIAKAAFLSGRAINISKTTAAHALSYKITSDYGVPHGHAVSLSISNLMKINECSEKVIDPRGTAYVKQTISEIRNILNIKDIDTYFSDLFTDMNLEQNSKKLNINDIDVIAESVNIERLKNNPVQLTTEDLKKLLGD